MKEVSGKTFGLNWDHSYTKLPDMLYQLQQPTPVKAPQLAVFNEKLAAELGLPIDDLTSDEGIAVFSGNLQAPGSLPLAQAYAGHQFGHFTMLGDGRAILLGEHITPSGSRIDIQLKGSGRTPYSRGGDGRAALGPMLREYIISEALHGLGIRTTRSLAVVETGETVQRERALPGAILTRIAASHLRVGTFQYAANWGGVEVLEQLVHYAIARHYPELVDKATPALHLLQAVIHKQAKLMASWQHVGFIHGVMNTDNMTISGESIDFGPCAFMNTFDLATVFSSIDRDGRYAYGNQPQIAAWNLTRLAESLLPLLDPDSSRAVELAEEALSEFGKHYQSYWLSGMRRKLGLVGEESADDELILGLITLLQEAGVDYTNTFRGLTLQAMGKVEKVGSIEEHVGWLTWHEQWQKRRINQAASEQQSIELMQRSNPYIIARNHIVEQVLASAVDQGDIEPLEAFVAALQEPYAYDDCQRHDQLFYNVEPPEEELDRNYVTFCGT